MLWTYGIGMQSIAVDQSCFGSETLVSYSKATQYPENHWQKHLSSQEDSRPM